MKTGLILAAAFWGSVAAFGIWGWLAWTCAFFAAMWWLAR